MCEKQCRINAEDTMHDVISKLCAVTDFMQAIGKPDFIMYERTHEGLYLIMTECISTLKKIGGLHDQPTN